MYMFIPKKSKKKIFKVKPRFTFNFQVQEKVFNGKHTSILLDVYYFALL